MQSPVKKVNRHKQPKLKKLHTSEEFRSQITTLDEEVICNRHESTLIASLNDFRLNEVLTDVILVRGQRQFLAHQIVLLSNSYFKKLVESSFEEHNRKTINLPSTISEEIVEILLEFIYTRAIPTTIQSDEELLEKCVSAASIFHVGDQFEAYLNVLNEECGAATVQDELLRNVEVSLKPATTFNFLKSLIVEKNSVMSDVTFICDEEEFKAHRVILSATSPYFQAMFAAEWTEKHTGRINLPTISAQVMKSILDFVYTGTLDSYIIHSGMLAKIFEAAHLMQLTDLSELCLKRICFHFKMANFQDLYSLSKLYDLTGFELRLLTLLACCFNQMTETEYYEVTLHQLKRVLQHPELNKALMENIISKVLQWIEFDSRNRSKYVIELISVLDLTSLSNTFRKNKLVKRYPEIIDIWKSQVCAQSFKEIKNPKLSYAVYLKMLQQSDRNCRGVTNGQHLIRFGYREQKIYHVESNKMFFVKPTSIELPENAAMVGFDQFVYFLGGSNETSESTAVYKYCAATNSVTSVGGLKFAVAHAGAGVLDDIIYVVGGSQSVQTNSRIVQRFIPATNFCEEVSPTNKVHPWPKLFSFQGKLYVVSDEWIAEDGKREGFIECYDCFNNQWTVVTQFPKGIRFCTGGLCLGKLYVASDIWAVEKMHVFDLLSRKWSTVCIRNKRRVSIVNMWQVLKRGNEVLLVSDYYDCLHMYDVLSSQWEYDVGCWLGYKRLGCVKESSKNQKYAIVNNLHVQVNCED